MGVRRRIRFWRRVDREFLHAEIETAEEGIYPISVGTTVVTDLLWSHMN
jgi:hypothetical protein